MASCGIDCQIAVDDEEDVSEAIPVEVGVAVAATFLSSSVHKFFTPLFPIPLLPSPSPRKLLSSFRTDDSGRIDPSPKYVSFN
jgi:hypothetical protein